MRMAMGNFGLFLNKNGAGRDLHRLFYLFPILL